MAITVVEVSDTDVVANQKCYAINETTRIGIINDNFEEIRSKAVANEDAQEIGGIKTFTAIPVFSLGANMASKKITAVLDPTADQDAATKKYVDDKEAISPASIADDTESVLLTNGLIMKFGKHVGGTTSETIEFAVEFPNKRIYASVTGYFDSGDYQYARYSPTIIGEADETEVSQMVVHEHDGYQTGYYWQAIGY